MDILPWDFEFRADNVLVLDIYSGGTNRNGNYRMVSSHSIQLAYGCIIELE